MTSRRNEPSTLLDRGDLEMLNSIEMWAEGKFQKVTKIREIYSEDHRPKVEANVLLSLIRAVKDLKDFYTLPN